MVFTQTPEEGISQFPSSLSAESFRSFHLFRTIDVTTDRVQRASSLQDVFQAAQSKPVLLKMYEDWCGHCKKLKKHFQVASLSEASQVQFMDVECSKAGNACAQFGVSGYPTVVLLVKTGDNYSTMKVEARNHITLSEFVANADNWEGKTAAYTGEVPMILTATQKIEATATVQHTEL